MSDITPNTLHAETSPAGEGGTWTTPPSPPSLSVCMIVRDEEKNLRRCLESLTKIGDYELVVVDTGSTDRTMEIAAEFGAKIFEHPWEKSFCKARNQATGHATSDWVLSIDADEVLEGGEYLLDMLRRMPPNIGGGVMMVEDMKGEDVDVTFSSVRLYRRDRKPKWVSDYHNQLTLNEGEKNLALLQGVTLRHFGYDLPPEEMCKKLDRTEEIIMQDLPGNHHMGYFYLAHQKAKRNEPEAAIRHGRKYVENMRGKPQFNASIYHILFHCGVQLGEPKEADRWLTLAIQDIPNDLDIAYDLVLYGEWMDRPDLQIEGGRRYMAIYEHLMRDPSDLGNRFCYHLNQASYAFVMRRSAACLAKELSGALERHKKAVGALPAEKAAAERESISSDLAAAGASWTNQ